MKMSYYGNDGPSQDGGFLSGINRGSQRLHAARSNRLRHASMNGFGDIEKAKQSPYANTAGFVEDYLEQPRLDPEVVATVSSEHNTNTIVYRNEKAALINMPEGSTDEAIAAQKEKVKLAQEAMESSRIRLDKVISSGPYMREYKAWSGGGLLVLGLGLVGVYFMIKDPRRKKDTKGEKSAMYAVFG